MTGALGLATIDHTGIAVEEMEAALALYTERLGFAAVHREIVAEQGAEAAILVLGGARIELVAPLGAGAAAGSALARFLARRGPGLHHIAYRVEDIERALATLSAAGVALIDERPRRGVQGSRVAFLHPSACGGVLTELVEPATHT